MSPYAPRFRTLLDDGFTAADARTILRLEDRENDLLDLLAQPACRKAIRDAVEAELRDVQDRLANLAAPGSPAHAEAARAKDRRAA